MTDDAMLGFPSRKLPINQMASSIATFNNVTRGPTFVHLCQYREGY